MTSFKIILLAAVLFTVTAAEAHAQDAHVFQFSYAFCQRMRSNQTLAYVYPNDPSASNSRTGAILSSSLGSSPNYNVVACPLMLPFGNTNSSLRPKKIEINYRFFSDSQAPTTQYFRCQLEIKSNQVGIGGLTSQFQNPPDRVEGTLTLDVQSALAAGSYATTIGNGTPWLSPAAVNSLTILCTVPQSNTGAIEGYSVIYE